MHLDLVRRGRSCGVPWGRPYYWGRRVRRADDGERRNDVGAGGGGRLRSID